MVLILDSDNNNYAMMTIKPNLLLKVLRIQQWGKRRGRRREKERGEKQKISLAKKFEISKFTKNNNELDYIATMAR